MRLRTGLLSLSCLLIASSAFAQSKKLKVGDVAPGLSIETWVKGEEVSIEKGEVYIVEFWATWCGPCRASMPHLSKLQEKYQDYATIIGVSDEPLATVVPFLFEKDKYDDTVNNDRTRYTLCTDPDESVKQDYFRAAGQRGIPTAFIIGKDQKVE